MNWKKYGTYTNEIRKSLKERRFSKISMAQNVLIYLFAVHPVLQDVHSSHINIDTMSVGLKIYSSPNRP